MDNLPRKQNTNIVVKGTPNEIFEWVHEKVVSQISIPIICISQEPEDYIQISVNYHTKHVGKSPTLSDNPSKSDWDKYNTELDAYYDNKVFDRFEYYVITRPI